MAAPAAQDIFKTHRDCVLTHVTTSSAVNVPAPPVLAFHDMAQLDTAEKLDSAIAKLNSEVRILSRARNGFAPINRRLPAEVLCEIFLYLMREHQRWSMHEDEVEDGITYKWRVCVATYRPPRWSTSYALSWITITHVCRHWREAALNYPLLWSTITDATSHWFSASLQRSGSAPLDLRLLGDQHTNEDEIMAAVVENRHRLRVVELHADSCLMSVLSNAPVLEALHVHRNCRWSSELLPTGVEFYLPRLSRLDVGQLSPPVLRGIARSAPLTILRWQQQRIFTSPSLDEWMEVLAILPHLEELTFQGGGDEPPSFSVDVSSPPPSRRVVLAKLRRLSITGSASQHNGPVAQFLSHIVISPSTTMFFDAAVTFDFTREPPSRILSAFADMRSDTRLGSASTLLSFRITISENDEFTFAVLAEAWTEELSENVLTADTEDPLYNQIAPLITFRWLSCNDGGVSRMLQSLLEGLPLSQVSILRFANPSNIEFTPQNCYPLEGVRYLHVNHFDDIVMLSQHPSVPTGPTDDHPMPSISFPNLDSLSIGVTASPDPLGWRWRMGDPCVRDIREFLHWREDNDAALKRLWLGCNIDGTEAEMLELADGGLVDDLSWEEATFHESGASWGGQAE